LTGTRELSASRKKLFSLEKLPQSKFKIRKGAMRLGLRVNSVINSAY
jgi:hypothetical protein